MDRYQSGCTHDDTDLQEELADLAKVWSFKFVDNSVLAST